jgi:tetratricopeptide (TPR) repeat protein
VDGALEHLLDALSLRPDPEVECRARLLRARLLQPIEPMVSWHEALRVVELGRDHGLIRHEVLAWGVAGEAMVMLGRADEAVERLRAGLARLEAHGEVRMASEARLQLGAAQRAAGRDRAAAESWRAALDAPPPALGTTALDARAHLGVLAVLSVDPESLAALSPMPLPLEPAARAAWSLLGGLMALMDDDPDAAAPSAAAVASAVALGVPGLFLARVAVAELERAGRAAEAAPLDAALREVCRRDGVDLRAADPWFDRYLRARG